MREQTGVASAALPARDTTTPRARPHSLLALQAAAGNRATAGLVALQRCGPIPHDQCPCNTEDEPAVQRVADGAGLISGSAAPPAAFGASLPELGGSLAELRAGDGPGTTGRLPSLDQRPGAPAAKPPARPAGDAAVALPPPRQPDGGPLELSGDADPARAHRASEAALGELGAAARASGQEAAADHGENAIGQAAPPVHVRPAQLTVPPVDLAVPAIVPAGSDSPAAAQAENSLTGWLGERTTAAAATLRTQETAGRDQVDKAVGDGNAQLAKASEDTTARQHSIGVGVQQDVAGERGRWSSATQSLHAEYATSTRTKLSALDANVGGIVGEAERGAKKEYAQAKNPSLLGGVFDKLKQTAGALFDRAKQAVKGLYDAARAKVSGLVGAFTDAVRAGAAAVAEKIKATAARAKAAIEAKVRAAMEAVRTAAAGLAALGRRVLDGVSRAVRAALAVIGRAIRAAMDTLRKAAEAVKKALRAMADLLRKIAKYEPAPVGLYAMAEKYKKLGERLSAAPPVTAQLAGAVGGGKGSPPIGNDPLDVGPAGGCGVCKGTAQNAGIAAHTIVQTAFKAVYPDALAEFPIPQKAGADRPLQVDLARWRPGPGRTLAIGEIKPANEKGYTDGVSSIAKYLIGVKAIDPDLNLVPLTEPAPPAFYPNPEGGPTCPTQKLFVYPPVGGVYGYHCIPGYQELIRRGQCKCDKQKPPPIPVTKKKEAKDEEKEDAPSARGVSPALAFAIAAAFVVLAVAVGVAIFSPEPISKTAGALTAVALFIGLGAMLAKAEGGGSTA